MRRYVIALGAMRSSDAILVLLELLACFPMDARLGEAIGWALANIGEGAVLPAYSFARRRDKLMPARAIAMVALGYIPDPRVPTILSNLWREYCTREPRLALAAVIGMRIHGEGETARSHAAQMERLWQAHARDHAAWTEDLRAAAASLAHTLDNVQPVRALPLWRDVLEIIG